MKVWICVVCGLIYEEEKGWPEDGIPPERAGKMFPQIGNARNVTQVKLSLK